MNILASASPRRKELLKRILSDFEVIPADIDESVWENEAPDSYAMRMSQTKANCLAEQYPSSLIIAADTIVALDKKILGKPCDRKEAFEMLESYSDSHHKVLTSVSLVNNGMEKSFIVEALVYFYPLSAQEIESYLDKNEWQDKAGAYGIQDSASLFVKEIRGDFFTIVGLPVSRIYRELLELGAIDQI